MTQGWLRGAPVARRPLSDCDARLSACPRPIGARAGLVGGRAVRRGWETPLARWPAWAWLPAVVGADQLAMDEVEMTKVVESAGTAHPCCYSTSMRMLYMKIRGAHTELVLFTRYFFERRYRALLNK